MAINFLEIPSAVEIPEHSDLLPSRTVFEEISFQQEKLEERTTICRPIPLLYHHPRCGSKRYTYRFYYICSQYKPHYCCKHTGNVTVNRDVLTKQEYTCYLSRPKQNYAHPRQPARFYYKRILLPNTTTRIVKLAAPKKRFLEYVLQNYGHILPEKKKKKLNAKLEDDNSLEFTTVKNMICFIQEEKRLQNVAKKMRERECRQVQQLILKQQRKQIRRIICLLFEEMREFLLNDEFVIDDSSPLACAIWKQIRNFTDCQFRPTKNLREYQQVLANNLAVWINKFISNLDIKVQPPEVAPRGRYCEPPKSFLPIDDYISLTDEAEGGDNDLQENVENECVDDEDISETSSSMIN